MVSLDRMCLPRSTRFHLLHFYLQGGSRGGQHAWSTHSSLKGPLMTNDRLSLHCNPPTIV